MPRGKLTAPVSVLTMIESERERPIVLASRVEQHIDKAFR